MSRVSARLRDRVIEGVADHDEVVVSTLADLPAGARARIVDVRDAASPSTARRLVDLGFTPGTEVEMLRRAPLADPVVFRVAGYEIALRRAQARAVLVATLR